MAETESGARSPSGLERWLALATGRCGFESHCGKLRFGTLAIPFTPLRSVGPFSLVSTVYARGSKISHQSALECVGETGASCYNFHSKSLFNKNMQARYFFGRDRVI